ncbi:hypothetical protein, partial [Parasphingorhabdus sp.]|uniref:hypothetical protein n=1 Tax=Parasphingorhabdus sp. TaxID=2709688 RepID=UPI003C7851E2
MKNREPGMCYWRGMRQKFSPICNRLTEMLADARGSLAPIFALTLFCIIALVGAALALAMDSKSAANLQAAADSSALAGATAFINATSPRAQDRKAEAIRLATAAAKANAHYALTRMDVGQIVEDPYGQKTEVTVDLSFEPTNPASKMAGRNANISINRSASASATWGFPLCILALNNKGAGLAVSDHSELLAENCVVWSNSQSSNSMSFSGGTSETKFFCAGGSVRTSSAARVVPRPHERCDRIPDPLEDWVPPAAGTPNSVLSTAAGDPRTYDIDELIWQIQILLNDAKIKNTVGGLSGLDLYSGEPMEAGLAANLLQTVTSLVDLIAGGSGTVGSNPN